MNSGDESSDEIPPHCHITIRCTREIAGFNGLGEAVRRLDFRSSVRDRRRFQYVCSLLRLLVSHKGIASLPGSAQRLLLQMLEEVAEHGECINRLFDLIFDRLLLSLLLVSVSDSQQNINVLRGLVMQLQKIVSLENQKCWGKPLGSQMLWKGHVETIQRIQNMATRITIKEVSIGSWGSLRMVSISISFTARTRCVPEITGLTGGVYSRGDSSYK